ncbi:(3,5-dihydroxycyclohex-3-enyl)acetyl-CoA dehydratase subunit B [Streptomyces sp. TverLS-915]|uniref:enoyl-CoA-hydratase DpgB n=1 Tax=unclassified Streptomyces TaxID=2593676 RepID=UPI00081E9257|nr:enoyl-CoA-hydratase DpgB [Streptomyces sp. TverLS-915]SCE14348.1 (3,5-dihydroxycyclohex-3-enyl)acetyl-CoA dehydratase subunit B [Streptomyces sp. TverLS-915]
MLTASAHATVELTIDGAEDLTPPLVARVQDFCDRAEDADPGTPAVLRLGGVANGAAPLDVALVNKWERALRRVERLPVTTVAVVSGACGGLALEALLATDYRIATAGTSLTVPVRDGAAWPGMALYRLANQVGVAAVRRNVLFDEPLAAPAALSLGLLDRLVDDEAEAVSLVGALPKPGGAPGPLRQLLLEATTTTFEEALGRHLAACDRVLRGGER